MPRPSSRHAFVFASALAVGGCGSSSGDDDTGGGGSGAGGSGGGGGSTSSSPSSSSGPNAGGSGGGTEIPGWTLAWSDEFDGADGSAPDPAKWQSLEGGDGWGNQELEYYRAENAVQQHGSLVITATKEGASAHACWYGACQFTSARLQTKGLFEQQDGRFEARIRVPRGQGLWPAFWLLGNDIGEVGWPACGEIDVMENIGREPTMVHGTIHGPGYSGGEGLTGSFTLPNDKVFADDFHTFAVEWEGTELRFYVDGEQYGTKMPADAPEGADWVYDHPFFMLLNVAVGGGWPGSPDDSTVFPQAMNVDYVRVYRRP